MGSGKGIDLTPGVNKMPPEVQVQMGGNDNIPWSVWINERAIIRPLGPDII